MSTEQNINADGVCLNIISISDNIPLQLLMCLVSMCLFNVSCRRKVCLIYTKLLCYT